MSGRKQLGNRGRKATPTCSFCGRAPDEENGLILGPSDVGICHSCAVLTCTIVIEERRAAGKEPLSPALLENAGGLTRIPAMIVRPAPLEGKEAP